MNTRVPRILHSHEVVLVLRYHKWAYRFNLEVNDGRWAYRCHLGVDRVRDSLARTCVPEKRKLITWPVAGVDLQTLYVDVPWLDTGIESGK